MHALQASTYAEVSPVQLLPSVCTSYHILRTLYSTNFLSFEPREGLKSLQNAAEGLLCCGCEHRQM